MMASQPPVTNIWSFLDRLVSRLPGWPTERQLVMYVDVALIWVMLRMARENGTLWNVELFKVILQALALTGFLNMVMAFFYSANRSDEQKSDATAKMADAVVAAATGIAPPTPPLTNIDAAEAADQVAEAASDKAADIKGG